VLGNGSTFGESGKIINPSEIDKGKRDKQSISFVANDRERIRIQRASNGILNLRKCSQFFGKNVDPS
jgi:hypothetical protein